MQDSNLVRSIDKIINIIIGGIIIQFFLIGMISYSHDSAKVYTISYKGKNLSGKVASSVVAKASASAKEILRKKITNYSHDVLEKDKEDVLIIKVRTDVKSVVSEAQKQLGTKDIKEVKEKPVKETPVEKEVEIPSIWHRVKRGETLSEIARLYSINVNTLKTINNQKNDIIFEGQKLKISKVEGVDYKVKKGDSLWVIAKKYGTNIKNIMESNGIDNYEIKIGETLKVYPGEKWFLAQKRENAKVLSWPLDNKITSPYGFRIHPIYNKKVFHSGVDIRGGIGEEIKAAGSGTVEYAGNKGGYGKVVIIKHRQGYETRYAHCSRLLVKAGEKIQKGQIIAKVGNTGVSTGSHLHFEVRKFNKTVNPMTFK